MSSTARTSTALVLALVLAAFASVLDGCVVFCVAQRPANVPPTCHHARSAALQIGRMPTPCTHAHTGIVAIVRADRSRFTRVAGSIAANALALVDLNRLSPHIVAPATRPGPIDISLDRPLALRI